MRIQKFLSDAGVASRRRAEELITDGRVLINGQVVVELPAFVDPQHDRVVVDGDLVAIRPTEHWLLHKPKGVVCTTRDPSGRRRAVDFLPPEAGRLFPVGRLDAEASGLLLLTNDGELAEQIAHPRYGVIKVYRAEVRGQVPQDLPAVLRKGVYLSDGRARAERVEVLHRSRDLSTLEITLHEAGNRQIRRMMARLGFPVKKLIRVRVGPLELKGLPAGAARLLNPLEVDQLRRDLETQRRETDAADREARQNRPPRRPHQRRRDEENLAERRRIVR
ncbi:MAG: rRNA pseudouridine synthase [Planctomycetes bacterium]|nr:rRNA pseudouridine synthase [Planctomycetota bacterium]